MTGRFELYKDIRDRYRFRLKTDSGRNILASEGFRKKADALDAIVSVMQNAPEAALLDQTAPSGEPGTEEDFMPDPQHPSETAPAISLSEDFDAAREDLDAAGEFLEETSEAFDTSVPYLDELGEDFEETRSDEEIDIRRMQKKKKKKKNKTKKRQQAEFAAHQKKHKKK